MSMNIYEVLMIACYNCEKVEKIGINYKELFNSHDCLFEIFKNCDDDGLECFKYKIRDFLINKSQEDVKNWLINQLKFFNKQELKNFIVNVFLDFSEDKKYNRVGSEIDFIKQIFITDKDVLYFLIDNNFIYKKSCYLLPLDKIKFYIKAVLNDKRLLDKVLLADDEFIKNINFYIKGSLEEKELLINAVKNKADLDITQYVKICKEIDLNDLVEWHVKYNKYAHFFPKEYINKNFILNLDKTKIISDNWFENDKFIKEFNELSEDEIFNIIVKNKELLHKGCILKVLSNDFYKKIIKEYKNSNIKMFDMSNVPKNKEIIIEGFNCGYGKSVINSMPLSFWYDIEIIKCICKDLSEKKLIKNDILKANNIPENVVDFFNDIENEKNIAIELKGLILKNELINNKEIKKLKI